jgi:energy-coupling factor transporter ATP-binding protein EcfA2
MGKLSINEALNVLSAWSVLEILSPQSFNEQKDLAGGKQERVVFFTNNIAPWEKRRKVPRDKKLFYQIVVGTIDLNEAINLLYKKYKTEKPQEDEKEEYGIPTVTGESIIGVIIVDENGYLIKNEQSITLSSFAWGVPQALKDDLKKLKEWSRVEKEIEKSFRESLQREDKEGKPLPLDAATIDEAYNNLIKTFGLPSTITKNEKFAITSCISTEKAVYPQPLMINSFFLNDLLEAKRLLKNGQAPETLLKYLGVIEPIEKYDILKGHSILEEVVAPHNIPAAKWPGPGRHPLVLLQQAAVNISMNKLKENDILGINGPPGTGKTTLLRDMIAGLVSRRAEAMVEFEDPEHAFIDSGDRIKYNDNDGELNLYTLHESLHGFEILIASSNNKAVENISTELPSLRAIDKDIDVRYFSTISNALLQEKGEATWGLMAAVLGNSTNRSAFYDKFWENDDYSIDTYLLEVTGNSQPEIEIKDSVTGQFTGQTRPSRVLEENSPFPNHHREALGKWAIARENFKEVLNKTKSELAHLEDIRSAMQELDKLESSLAFNETLEGLIIRNKKEKPSLIFRILGTPTARSWRKEYKRLSHWQTLKEKVANLPEALTVHLVNNNLLRKEDKLRQQLVPWCDKQIQLLRDEVFISAVKVHKAFIDAAAYPIRHNLGAFMRLVSNTGNCIFPEMKVKFIKDLWSTFFLVVPSVSTTFASISRMLEGILPDTLGWLLIDEAGQATPQAAVGAIIRSKRAIITGDPLQIKPIVTLPEQLTQDICKEFEVDANRFNAPKASVQTLADQASSYFAQFDRKGNGTRKVGLPLLVHRRCEKPMFSISNTIAYGGSMVQGKVTNYSPIRECLGKSTWFHVAGRDIKKWCPEEDTKVLELLTKLKNANIQPNLYIVSPFKNVADNLCQTIKNSKILDGWLTDEKRYSWPDQHIGTVHTLQGREAEAIILVLGAQNLFKEKARDWAGIPPNLLNVAVTRAKEVMYVIGNRNLWRHHGAFKELHHKIEAYNMIMDDPFC